MSIQPLPPLKEASIPGQLIESIRLNKAILMVGAGFSISQGFPTWSDLLLKLYNKLVKDQGLMDPSTKKWVENNISSQPEWTAELLKKFVGESSFDNFLRDSFAPEDTKSNNSLQHALVALIPFSSYITTNYDSLLENHISLFKVKKPNIVVHSDINETLAIKRDRNNNIYKIHGCANKSIKSLILTSSDYYELLQNQTYVRFISSLLTENSVLTIGYSLRDRDFRQFIEERYHLFKSNCSPMYAILTDENCCDREIDLYREKYNVHIIMLSSANKYAEVSSFLLSLYCVIYKIDSSIFGQEILSLINKRLTLPTQNKSESDQIITARKLLSIFKDPVDINIFSSICSENNINLSPAHYKIIAKSDSEKITSIEDEKITGAHIKIVANWMHNYLRTIPVAAKPLHLSIYNKKIINEFHQTIYYLLSEKEGWDILIGNDDKSAFKITRYNEFFMQEGKWKEWLELTKIAEKYTESKVLTELMKSKALMQFWTRDVSGAKATFKKYESINENQGRHSYDYRIAYMENKLSKLIKDLEKENISDKLDYYNLSLLGRSYARSSLTKAKKAKKMNLYKAKEYIELALQKAKEDSSMVETAVQTWYLALICNELELANEAKLHLAETKRLDESIMNRIPGIAWLSLAEYHFARVDNSPNTDDFRAKAREKMSNLGICDVDHYIDNDYFY